MTRKEELECIFWDFYKDVHGVRPRHVNTQAMTEAELEAEIAELDKVAVVVFAEEKVIQEQCIVRFEKRVADIIATGAGDRATAIRWIHDAENTNGDDEFLCYCVGVPYGYFKN